MSEGSEIPSQLEPETDESATEVLDGVAEAAVESLAANADQAWKMLALVNDWIKHAETKAAGTIAASGVSAGVLYNLLKSVAAPSRSIEVLAAICGALLAFAGLAAAWALRPRLWSREEPTSSLYFHHIARRHGRRAGSAAYGSIVRELSVADAKLVGEIASQIWANAHVARAKYRWANIGLSAILFALIALSATAFAVARTGW